VINKLAMGDIMKKLLVVSLLILTKISLCSDGRGSRDLRSWASLVPEVVTYESVQDDKRLAELKQLLKGPGTFPCEKTGDFKTDAINRFQAFRDLAEEKKALQDAAAENCIRANAHRVALFGCDSGYTGLSLLHEVDGEAIPLAVRVVQSEQEAKEALSTYTQREAGYRARTLEAMRHLPQPPARVQRGARRVVQESREEKLTRIKEGLGRVNRTLEGLLAHRRFIPTANITDEEKARQLLEIQQEEARLRERKKELEKMLPSS